jgi:hypothetical protein
MVNAKKNVAVRPDIWETIAGCEDERNSLMAQGILPRNIEPSGAGSL